MTPQQQKYQMMGVKPVRHKPILKEAAEVTTYNMHLLSEWVKENGGNAYVSSDDDGYELWVLTLKGWVIANVGEFLIRGLEREFYPMDRERFHNSYENVPNEG